MRINCKLMRSGALIDKQSMRLLLGRVYIGCARTIRNSCGQTRATAHLLQKAGQSSSARCRELRLNAVHHCASLIIGSPARRYCLPRSSAVVATRAMATGSDPPAAAAEKRQNRLANEKSPYLLQHASNPVDW